MPTKKIKLKVLEYDFVVFAISSAEDDYRLVWLLNGALDTNLCRQQHHPQLNINGITNKKISYFTYEKNHLDYTLIGNKYDEMRLFSQLPTTDFVLKISGNLTELQIDEISAKIRSVKEITACINLNVKKSPQFGVFERI